MESGDLADLVVVASLCGVLLLTGLGLRFLDRGRRRSMPPKDMHASSEFAPSSRTCPLCGDDLDAIDPTSIGAFLARKATTAINDIPGVTASAHFRADGSGLCIVEHHDVSVMTQCDFARVSLLHWREAPIHVTASNGDTIILSPSGYVSRHKEVQ